MIRIRLLYNSDKTENYYMYRSFDNDKEFVIGDSYECICKWVETFGIEIPTECPVTRGVQVDIDDEILALILLTVNE